jgi:hypothetical protein
MPEENKKTVAAREALDLISEISNLLVRSPTHNLLPFRLMLAKPKLTRLCRQNTHLTRKQLASCVSLIQNGVNPEALAVCTTHSWQPLK